MLTTPPSSSLSSIASIALNIKLQNTKSSKFISPQITPSKPLNLNSISLVNAYCATASPRKNVGENDNRGSHFYLALYWADELAKSELSAKFSGIAAALNENKSIITDELNGSQGNSVDVGGYYIFDDAKVSAVMRPSAIYNQSLKK